MESITALIACAAAFAFSYYIGRAMNWTTTVAATMGGVCGLVFAVLFFVIGTSIGALLPGTFDAWSLGVHFLVLLIVAPAAAAAIAALEHRHEERVEDGLRY
jgi:hypothetical protein